MDKKTSDSLVFDLSYGAPVLLTILHVEKIK